MPTKAATRAQKGLSGIEPIAGVSKANPILVIDGVIKRFGGITAVEVEHLEFQANAITALIGPNGAGKTTLFNLLTGFDQSDDGRWTFGERSIQGVSAYRIARLGMVRTFQLTKALSKLTVIDNMLLGAKNQRGERFFEALAPWSWQTADRAIESRADALLERFNLGHMRDELAGTMSGGQRKLLEMARALMSEPRLLMLDEPMAGVNPALTQSLLGHIKALADDGLTVIFVEHDMDVVREISDWVVVMSEGHVIAEGPHESIGRNQSVIDAYLGTRHAHASVAKDSE